jgi:TldD protein
MSDEPSGHGPVLEAALAELRRAPGVTYADARLVETDTETVALRMADVDKLAHETTRGIGIRVIADGAWGFAATPTVGEAAAVAAARDALEVARASAQAAPVDVVLAEEEPQRGRFATAVAIDPFAVPLERKLAELAAAIEVLRGDGKRIHSAEARMIWRRERKWFASTEGTQVEQVLTCGGAGIQVIAADGDEIATRSWPMEYDGGIAGAGYETVVRLDLLANAARIREEALELLVAPRCPNGARALLLDTPQLALQIHESCGHPTELDRALGEEISLAGASFLTPDKLGRFRYGSTLVNLTADATRPEGPGTFGWDDEGVAARRTPLVSRGMFVGYLSSRETAHRLGLGRSAGCMRAESYARPPIIRMINVSLEPDRAGPRDLEELVADTADGVLMSTNRSWSIDDLRLGFQFSCEAGWEIKRGKRTRLLRTPLYGGTTPRFWSACDAVCGPEAFRMWGFLTCGKGDPMQLMAVGHGTPPARFRDVEIGSAP